MITTEKENIIKSFLNVSSYFVNKTFQSYLPKTRFIRNEFKDVVFNPVKLKLIYKFMSNTHPGKDIWYSIYGILHIGYFKGDNEDRKLIFKQFNNYLINTLKLTDADFRRMSKITNRFEEYKAPVTNRVKTVTRFTITTIIIVWILAIVFLILCTVHPF